MTAHPNRGHILAGGEDTYALHVLFSEHSRNMLCGRGYIMIVRQITHTFVLVLMASHS